MTTPLSFLAPVAALVISASPAVADREGRSETLISRFANEAEARRWIVVNDDVMGGLSRGTVAITDAGTLRFTGTTSLRNNGGFSSIRMRPSDLGLAGHDGLAMRVLGDGRTYKLTLEAVRPNRRGSVSYWASFATRRDEWATVRVPFRAFIPHFRGTRLAGPTLDPAAIRSVGFMIYDKNAGPFALQVDDLRAWREDGGDRATTAGGTIPEVAGAAGSFKTLLAAVNAAGLSETLAGDGPFTVFAPTDEAFGKLPSGTVDALLEPASRERLVAILKNHVVEGRKTGLDAANAGRVRTIGGQTLSIALEDGRLRIGGATVVANDVAASNGVIHVIDTVLLPPEPRRAEVDARVRLFVEAIDRGVPLFNEGNPGACVAVYEIAVMAVLSWPDGNLSTAAREHLARALSEARRQRASAAAWTLRRAMDAAIAEFHGAGQDA